MTAASQTPGWRKTTLKMHSTCMCTCVTIKPCCISLSLSLSLSLSTCLDLSTPPPLSLDPLSTPHAHTAGSRHAVCWCRLWKRRAGFIQRVGLHDNCNSQGCKPWMRVYVCLPLCAKLWYVSVAVWLCVCFVHVARNVASSSMGMRAAPLPDSASCPPCIPSLCKT